MECYSYIKRFYFLLSFIPSFIPTCLPSHIPSFLSFFLLSFLPFNPFFVHSDEDLGCSKSMALVVRGEGGVFPDPYSTLQEGGRLSIASSQGSAPAPLADVVDRAAIKPYGDILEQQHSLYR